LRDGAACFFKYLLQQGNADKKKQCFKRDISSVTKKWLKQLNTERVTQCGCYEICQKNRKNQ